MAGEAGLCYRSPRTVAVLLLLCTLATSLSGFSLQGLSRNAKPDKVVSEASRVKIRTGSILFNGKELNSDSGSPSAAATNDDGLTHVDTDQPEGSGMFAETSQLNEVMAKEGAWRRLNPALHCGQTKMKFIAMGPRAADLQLDIGNGHPLPLTQLPESCGFSLQPNALGLVLVAPYDGCNVIQENGNYVVSMTWLEAEVKLTCPILPSPDATWNHPVPHRPSSFYRPKRHVSKYDSHSPYLYWYYSYLNQYQAMAPTTTTAEPDTTTTCKPTAEIPKNPPVYPPYVYYPQFYHPYYYYYPLPQSAPTTTAPACTEPATTVPATTVPATTVPATTVPATTAPATTAPASTAPASTAPACTAPASTAPASTVPADPSGTAKPCGTSPTATPTTASTTTNTQPCSQLTTSSSGTYPGQLKPFVEYHESPFSPVISYAYNKDGKLPDYQKYMPQNGYKSGPQAQAHSGFDWRAAPWFFH